MVRPLELHDLFMLGRLQSKGIAFDFERTALTNPSPLQAGIVGLLTNASFGTMTLVDGKADAIGQVWRSDGGMTWNLGFMAPSMAYDSEISRSWLRLLTAFQVLGNEQGARRLRAVAPDDAEIEQTLLEAGMTVIGREQLFILTYPPATVGIPAGMRPMQPEDLAAVRALQMATTPRRLLECGGVSLALATRRRHLLSPSPQEYVWILSGKIAAYLGLVAGPSCYWLDVIVRPDHRAELVFPLRYILGKLACSAQMPVYAAVPDYTVGTGWVLRTLGFELFARQTRMLSELVSRVPSRRLALIPGFEGSVQTGAPIRTCQKTH